MQTASSLSPNCAALLEQFSKNANKGQAFAAFADFEQFCKFAVLAHVEKTNLDDSSLIEILKSQGWPADQADVVAKRYKAAKYMLKMHDHVRAGNASF